MKALRRRFTRPANGDRRSTEALVLLLVALFIGVAVAPFASGSPDGYERVAIDAGFADSARDSVTAASPLADYALGPVSAAVGVALLAVLGLCVVALGRVGRVERVAKR